MMTDFELDSRQIKKNLVFQREYIETWLYTFCLSKDPVKNKSKLRQDKERNILHHKTYAHGIEQKVTYLSSMLPTHPFIVIKADLL